MPHKYEMNTHLRNNSSLYFTNYLNCSACYITRNYSSETQLEKQKKGNICICYSAKETQKWHIFFVFILSDILAAALVALLQCSAHWTMTFDNTCLPNWREGRKALFLNIILTQTTLTCRFKSEHTDLHTSSVLHVMWIVLWNSLQLKQKLQKIAALHTRLSSSSQKKCNIVVKLLDYLTGSFHLL